ncbi:GNAT family N-acetyltransferase [Lachnospiraceae bacterium HCP1S3_C3]
MQIKVYDFLADDAKNVRQKVFMEEQGFKNEFDDVDNVAYQIVMYDNNIPVATCRVFSNGIHGEFVLGRLAVIREYRGLNIGSKMIREAEKLVKSKGGVSIALHAQCRVKKFYIKSGYVEFGAVEDDEGCPHIWMKKQL